MLAVTAVEALAGTLNSLARCGMKAGVVDRKAGTVDRKAGMVDQKAGSIDRKAGSIDRTGW